MLEVKFTSNMDEVIEEIADHAIVGCASLDTLDVFRGIQWR